MKFKRLISVGAVAGLLSLAGCGGGDIKIVEGDEVVTPPPPPPPSGFSCPDFATQIEAIGSFSNVCQVTGTLTADATFTSNALWVLSGRVAVGNDRADSSTLTIEAGTTVIGRSGDDFLVVRRGSKIEASGTQSAPILMTSFEDITDAPTAIGQWGGLVLLGNAPSNLCDTADAGDDADATELANCSVNAEGDAGLYGGDDPNDNSGTLRYVIVKQAGKALGSGDELNGISFAGVGDATTVDYIQVHENLDDGVEFFGGTVNVKHVVLTGNGDDSFDWSFGWTGKAQYVYVQHNDAKAHRGFELDNNEDFPAATPLTNPAVSNITIVGSTAIDEGSEGILLRNGTAGRLHNVLVTGPAGMGECLEVNGGEAQANAEAGNLIMTHSVIACDNGENFKGNATAALTTENWFLGQAGNSAYSDSSALNLDVNGYQPLAGSPLLGAGTDASAIDAWFDATNYIGAFDGTNDWTEGWAVGVRGGFPANVQNAFQKGLATDVSSEFPQITDKPVYRLAANTTFTADVTFTNDAHWILNGRTAVGNDRADNTTLYVQQGTTIIGETGDDFLVARRGSKLEAIGTQGAPIVMTSIQDVTGQETGIGQWGGLVLLGNAPSNLCDTGDAGDDADATELANCSISAEGDAGLYGGDNPTDNSGSLKYVVVKHAGKKLSSGNELNGISFAGVGSETMVDYIQVHENLDDGVEFFGGTVNVRHVVLTGNGDDSFDWSFGWTGKAQFVYVQHNDNIAHRAFELDNNEDFPAATPLTNPIVSNVTIVGSNATDEGSEGVLLRNGTAGRLHNFVVTGPAGMGECLEVNGTEAQANAEAGNLIMTHSVIACENGENFKGDATSTQTVETWFLAQAGNSALDNVEALNLLADGYTPRAGSTLLGTGVDASDVYDDNWFKSTDYIGAFDGNTNWMDGWTVAVNTGIPASVTSADAQSLATDQSANYPAITDKPVYVLNTDVVFTTDVKLTSDKHWVLKGRTAVGNDKADNATLYIEPGTTLIGESGDDFLVARRGSKIEALGSASAPINMTSIQDMTGQATGIGQWGGLVLLGNAPSNLCDTADAGFDADETELANCSINAEGDAGLYGGNDPEDNSGTLRYVVVKYAGKALGSGDELNGISFAGVGSNTTVDYIQVHENLDDGVEFFGGSVNVRHVVLTGNGDDSFDWSFGWTGRAQYVLVKHNDTKAHRGFELDNNEHFPLSTPLTNPVVANITIIGSTAIDEGSEGVLLRNGTAGSLHNLIITGPAGMGECLEINGTEAQDNAQAGNLVMTHSVVACENGENFKGNATATQTTEEWFMGQTGNSVAAGMADVITGFETVTDAAALDMDTVDSWFDSTDFIGAVKAGDDWTAGWVTVGLE
ncbi:hypothetical protein [Aliikangiella coralliicola]|uniref:Lipoprotein n=1 Tax=Aliikangiella coralliicola TaxID=2592383 RepID=A0A545UFY6_9GAMM|nr:hypothetical protein [Aliikangiella coralliicola]TQV88379.1 hypothetical protein FLL46_07600 [Aliikangiella coralliicola]